MKRILIFSLAYYPKHIGGAEVAIKEITDRIPQEEIEFHMITNRYDSTLPKIEKIVNILVHRIGITTKEPSMADLRTAPLHFNKLLYQFLAYYKAKSLHRKYKYDAVWSMMAHAAGVPGGMFKKTFPEVKYILTLQEGDPPAQIERKMRIFGKRFHDAFTQADIVQVISNFLGAWSRSMGFTGTLRVIPNAVNVAHFSQEYSADELAEARAQIGKKEGDVFLVTTSRLVHKNAVDDVIRALPLLPAHVHFVVYGEGPDEVMLKTLASTAGVSERVHFLGQLDRESMPLSLKACDIFIRPSRSEGMGNSFVEAMAAGLPVIATQEGGIADFLFDEKRNPEKEPTGFAVDKDAPEQIRDAVLQVLNSPEKTNSVVENAKKMVASSYDWDLIAERMKREVFGIIV